MSKVDSRFIGNVEHNKLTELQGGSATERYHLSREEYNNAAFIATLLNDVVNGNFYPDHNDMTDIQGGLTDDNGKVTEAYHLTANELNAARVILSFYNEIQATF